MPAPAGGAGRESTSSAEIDDRVSPRPSAAGVGSRPGSAGRAAASGPSRASGPASGPGSPAWPQTGSFYWSARSGSAAL